jgi:two-component system cell cycle sensor histidine kinase/response regulator CckA
VEHDQDGASFVVSVRDTGTGISQELQDRIFEPYFTTKAAGKGTGLGLSSARGSITEMGGELLLVDSSPEGSCFEVRLAVVDEKASLPQQALARPVETAFEGRSVLLVEDDESVRDLLSALLVHLGFEVSTASDGQAGLEHMQSLLQDQTPPDVLVCDVQMPRMGGPEMLSELERDGCEIPTLLVSGWHRYTEAELLAGYSGPMRFLSKPVGLRGLQDALADLLF